MRAHILAFLYEDGALIATGAVKANPGHQAEIAADSGVPLPQAEYWGEVGYIHTAEEHRRHGHADHILKSLIEAGKGKELFATIQSLNVSSQRLLARHGYVPVGEAWPSKQTDDKVNLYIRPKAPPASQD